MATGSGVSSLGELLVVDDPVVVETSRHTARRRRLSPWRSTASSPGRSPPRKKSTSIASRRSWPGDHVQPHGQRLYFKRHYQEGGNSDPMLVLTDRPGDELAANDDYYFGDPLLHHRFEKDGDYFIAVRDVDYGGEPHFTYALAVTDRPFVTAVFPMAIPPTGPWTACASGFALPDGPLKLSGLSSPASPGPAPGPAHVERASDQRGDVRGDRSPIRAEVDRTTTVGGPTRCPAWSGPQRPGGSTERRRSLCLPPEGRASGAIRGQGAAVRIEPRRTLRLIDEKGRSSPPVTTRPGRRTRS